ncbi:hypothetical protein MATL_G00185680 [Megalops atlanticus]|uniref:Disintegrin and metalloproteinase domain-containing protein 8 n=1 Tax=Megalops atlanticus TaxID=7932 RepID=A0A9D3PKD7_MEGAT|nr:hypothetical protein MATL_G00185680 [Megalops atlanticus]
MQYILFFLSLTAISSWGLFVRSLQTLPHVQDYDVVRPQMLKVRAKRSLSLAQTYPEELHYALTIEGKNLTVHLEKNKFLMGKSYTETYYLENGTEVTTSPNHEDHCYYHGHVQDVEDSSVSVAVCSGIRGYLRAEQQVYLIEPLTGSAEGDHAVYRQERLRRKRSTCADSNGTMYDNGPRVSGLFDLGSWKSKPLLSRVKRFVEMFLVVDNAEYKRHGKNMEKIKARMLEVANHVDKVYRPLNIRVMLVGLEVWSDRDKMDVSSNPDETLTRFLKWREDSLVARKKHDNAQFVTGVDFEGSTVGLATKFAMCTGSSGAVNEDHNANPIGVASTIAHEMGHNLGMSHDTSLCSCGGSGYSRNCIMADSVGYIYPEDFSSCSKAQLSTFLEKANPSCLLDKPSADRIYGGPVCGNAFVEPGEECDCGTVEECQNPCCNASTCRLTEGSQCAEGECCHNCQLKPAGSLCRDSVGDCDLPELCTGQSAECPKDAFQMNGFPCNGDQGYCYNGRCPTHQQHCMRLWGPGARVAADACFYQNTYGTKDAHCRKIRYSYQKCAPEDVKCGKIFCTGGNEFPITGQKAILTLFRAQCNIALDMSDSDDLGMVPTGTKCGDNKVCYNNRCQDIKVYGTDECSAKCNNHGVCNHEKECHCEPGWAPPYCDVRLSDLPPVGNGVIIGASAAAAVLVLLMLVFGALLCSRKPKKHQYPNKPKVSASPGLSNPLFQDGSARGTPRSRTPLISEPTLVESTATQACTPLHVTVLPSRPPPQPPMKTTEKPPAVSEQVVKPNIPPPVAPHKPAYLQAKPQPPAKPLPPLDVKQGNKPKLPPPVPPAKPTGTEAPWKLPQVSGGQKVALRPPTKPR